MADEVLEVAVEPEIVDTEQEISSESTETGAGELSSGTESSGESEAVGAQLWNSVKERLKDFPKSESSAIRRAIHLEARLKREYPDGFDKVETSLAAVKRLADDSESNEPVETVIENTIAERTFWRKFDENFQAGNPELIQQMVGANSDSFQSLVPAALNEFAKLNPEGYSSLIAGIAMNYLDGAKLPLQFEILDMLLPQKTDDPGMQRVIQAFQTIKNTIEGLRGFSGKPVIKASAEPVKGKPDPDRENDLSQRENSLRDREWNLDVASSSNRMMADETAKIAGKNKFTSQEIDRIRSSVREEINARVRVNTEYQKTVKGYISSGNKSAYQQRVSSEHKKIIPNAVRRAVDDILAARKKNPVASPTAAAKKPPAASVDGEAPMERLSRAPQLMGLKIDHLRSTSAMLVKKQGYIVGRKNKVTWA